MVRRGLGKGSLRGVWLEQALSVKDCYLWLKSLSKNSCSIPYFQRSDVCLGSCNFSWKGWNLCCCGIIQFNIFPPFRTGFLSEKLADVPSIWNVFFVCFLPCNSKQKIDQSLRYKMGHRGVTPLCLQKSRWGKLESFSLLSKADVKQQTRKYETAL